MENKNSSLIPATILIAGLIIGGAIIYSGRFDNRNGTAGPTPSDNNTGAVVVSIDDDVVLGDPNAPVTIIEFSDYECPFCAKFWENTLPELKEKYINTGKAKFVYRDFPLSSHQKAQKAAEATECAQDQGRFWEMHDKIFENQSAIDASNLKQYAVDLGLDTSSFDECLDSNKHKSEVKKDFDDGRRAGVSGTPTFFIGSDDEGYEKLVGAQPFSAFEEVIERLIGNK